MSDQTHDVPEPSTPTDLEGTTADHDHPDPHEHVHADGTTHSHEHSEHDHGKRPGFLARLFGAK